MKILPFALLAGTLLLGHSALAQTATEQPASPPAPAASEPSAGSTAPTAVNPVEPVPTRQISVAVLTAETLKGQNGEALGDIAQVVENTTDNKTYLVVSRGGVLGFFGTEHLVPVDQVAVSGDGVITAKMTPAQLESSPTFDSNAHRALQESQSVGIPEQR